MKMTIVIDSEDIQGIEAAYSIASLMKKKYVRQGYDNYVPVKESFSKIEYIKLLRKYVKEQVEALNNPDNELVVHVDNMYSLRNTKKFADRIFNGER
tara:strand:- start:425 stop:715 length:291 start_codon:yes stop_codon:yes gene_type:complete